MICRARFELNFTFFFVLFSTHTGVQAECVYTREMEEYKQHAAARSLRSSVSSTPGHGQHTHTHSQFHKPHPTHSIHSLILLKHLFLAPFTLQITCVV